MSELSDLFTNIANAIRNKTGETAQMPANDFPTKINDISPIVYNKTISLPYNTTSTVIPELVGRNYFYMICNIANLPTQEQFKLYFISNEFEIGVKAITGDYNVFTERKPITFDKTTGTLTWTYPVVYNEFLLRYW